MDERQARIELEEVSRVFAAALQEASGNEPKERAACEAAVAEFMRIKQESGANPAAEPGELMCAEFFAEGDREIDSVFSLVQGAKDDDIGRWWEYLADAAGY